MTLGIDRKVSDTLKKVVVDFDCTSFFYLKPQLLLSMHPSLFAVFIKKRYVEDPSYSFFFIPLAAVNILQNKQQNIELRNPSSQHRQKMANFKSLNYISARNRKTENSWLLVPYSIKANHFCESIRQKIQTYEP